MTRRLRILLLTHGFPPESVGGVEQHTDGLCRALARSGHEVHIYTRTAAADRAQGELVTGEHVTVNRDPKAIPVTRVVYRWEGLEGLDDLYEVPLLEEALESFLAAHTFDVAHVHHMTGMSTGTLDVLAKHRIPTVLTVHDYWLHCPRGQMWHVDQVACAEVDVERCTGCLARTYRGWEVTADAVARLHQRAHALLQKPEAIVVPSARVIPPFAALGIPAERFEVVENGVATEHLHHLAPAHPTQAGPLRIGYLGTLIPSKGLDVLVEAVVRQPKGTVSLDIWGNAVPYHGDEGFLTRVFQKLSPDHAVTYHGPYRTDDLPSLLSQVDLVAAPALWHEAFGLTPREALAAGRGVLVSAVGGLRDAVPDGIAGRVLPPGDVDAWTRAIRELAQNPDQARAYGHAARRHGRGFDPMARDLETIYRRVAAR